MKSRFSIGFFERNHYETEFYLTPYLMFLQDDLSKGMVLGWGKWGMFIGREIKW